MPKRKTREQTKTPISPALRAYISWLAQEGHQRFSIGANNPLMLDRKRLQKQLGYLARIKVIKWTRSTLYPGGPRIWMLLPEGSQACAWMKEKPRTRPHQSLADDDELVLTTWLNNPQNKDEIGRKLRAARKQRKLTLAALASEAGVSSSQISFAENGKKNCGAKAIKRLADHLGVQLPVHGMVPLTPEEIEQLSLEPTSPARNQGQSRSQR